MPNEMTPTRSAFAVATADRPPPLRGRKISIHEWVFLTAVISAWGILAVVLGKETGWDFRNYHWYDAYAFLQGRMGVDVAVAHHATYYNPLCDIPFYFLATKVGSAAALAFLGAAQGMNIFPLYLISRAALAPAYREWGVPLLALVCLTGSTAFSLTGTTSYDAILSVLVLSGLAVLVVARESLKARAVMLAGFLVGSAVGLKLVEAPFAIGFAAALLVIPGGFKEHALRLAAGVVGGVLGVALSGGFWFATLWQQTGNPLFPYFNDVFGSPLALAASYRDTRFVPDGLWHALIFPFRFSFAWPLADDTPFQNLRVLAAYIALPVAAMFWAFGRQARDSFVAPSATRILFVFAGTSYIAWVAVFGIYRYIVALEMLAPLLIVAAIGFIPVSFKARQIAIVLVLAVTAVMARYDFGPRAAISDPYVQITGLKITHPETAMLLMAGVEPMGYIVPSLPPEIPVVRIDGWLASPRDGSEMTAQMKTRIARHGGELFLLFSTQEHARSERAAADYGLAISEAECGNVTTNLGGPYRFCPLTRVTPHE